MRQPDHDAFCAIFPYVVWMSLLFALEATAENYALRTALTSFSLTFVACLGGGVILRPLFLRGAAASLGWGVLVGLLVCVIWIAPESIPWYRDFSLLGALGFGGTTASQTASPYAPETCGWALTAIKLIGSAFVIAPVEEIFFRSFLYRWLQDSDWTKVPLAKFDLSAFVWMVGLFALEHHTRLAVGALAGAFYGYLAIRQGVFAAIIAHVVTNLLLGLYVIHTGQWGFW